MFKMRGGQRQFEQCLNKTAQLANVGFSNAGCVFRRPSFFWVCHTVKLITFVTFLPFRRCWTMICPVAWSHGFYWSQWKYVFFYLLLNKLSELWWSWRQMIGRHLSKASHCRIELTDPVPLVGICLLPSHLSNVDGLWCLVSTAVRVTCILVRMAMKMTTTLFLVSSSGCITDCRDLTKTQTSAERSKAILSSDARVPRTLLCCDCLHPPAPIHAWWWLHKTKDPSLSAGRGLGSGGKWHHDARDGNNFVYSGKYGDEYVGRKWMTVFVLPSPPFPQEK